MGVEAKVAGNGGCFTPTFLFLLSYYTYEILRKDVE